MLIQGQIYSRRELHEKYGGQEQGGISTPAAHPILMLFTGGQGAEYGYRDDWSPDGVFLYTGEGQVGDMTFVRGNRAIRDHTADQKDLHLFEYIQPGRVRYLGQMVCSGYEYRQAPDKNGVLRNVIVFELAPLSAFPTDSQETDLSESTLWEDPLSALRDKAISSATQGAAPVERRALVRQRSIAIKVYVLRRAQGICEACGNPAPFTTNAGKPYLEPHHIKRLSDGGPDHPEFVAALCPNCHRQAHYGENREELNTHLLQTVRAKETE